MATTTFTPQEAAAIADVPLGAVQKAITGKDLPARVIGSGGRRRIDETAVLALALTKRLPTGVRLRVKEAHKLLLRAGASKGGAQNFITIGGSLRVDLDTTLKEPRRRIRLLLRARKIVARSPEVNRGAPVIAGTRITVASLRDRSERGDTVEDIRRDHPVLDPETIESATLWAAANPPRGRPAKRPEVSSRRWTASPRDVSAWTKTMQITARQIEAWASGRDAQGALPRLVRRLIHGAGSVAEISVPAGDSTTQPDWDGRVTSEHGSAWVPKGPSFWEMSCEANPTAKASDDYRKRTQGTPQRVRRGSSFVSVTGRRWSGKERWLAQRRREKGWRTVRAFDADDIEQWLEQSPAVALQFADELGLMGRGVESLAKSWQDWAEQADPHISSEALFMTRERTRERIVAEIRKRIEEKSSGPVTLRADSVGEAVAFVCATLLEDPHLSASALVVTDAGGWRFVDQNPLLKVAVAARPEIADKPTRRSGLAVVIPYAAGDLPDVYGGIAARDTPDVLIERPRIHDFEKALTGLGVDAGDSERLASSTGRSWSVFRRRRARNPALREPAWFPRQEAGALSTVCLLGGWSAKHEADRAVVARVANRPYEDIERDLLRLANVDDSPLLRIGEVWKAKSPLELLDILGDRITRDELDRYFAVVEEVLAQPDPELELPEGERYTAQIHGKVRPQSGLLIRALCDTLIKLAVRGSQVGRLRALDLEERVNRLVRSLLYRCDAKRWLSLASLIPQLAEAAPEAFLDAIEESLARSDTPVTRLLTESSGPGMTGRCWHAGLLWALEILAWAPERLPRVTRLLARLTRTPIKGNWGNTPANTLLDIFRAWRPQTSATLDERIQVLDALLREEPDVGFELIDRLAHFGSETASPSARPKWRDDDAGAGESVTHGEWRSMVAAATDRMIDSAAGNAERTAKVLAKCEYLDPPRVEKVLALAQAFTEPTTADGDRETVRTAVRHKLHAHRNYRNRETRSAISVGRLQALYERLAPGDLITRDRWLFTESWPRLPVANREAVSGRRDLVERLRLNSLREILGAHGMEGVERLATSCPSSPYPGVTLAELSLDAKELAQWAVSRNGDLTRTDPLTMTVRGLLRATPQPRSTALIESILAHGRALGWDANHEARLLCLAREERATWNIASAAGSDTEGAYWALTDAAIYFPSNAREFEYPVRRLLDVRRPRSALHACSVGLKAMEPGLLAEILERLLQGEESDGPRVDPWDVGEAVDALETAGTIDPERLVRLEFALIPMLGFEEEQRAKSLYVGVMSNPALFTEVLCMVYKPRNSRDETEVSEADSVRAQVAWRVLRACRLQPATQQDGSVDKQAFVRFIDEARQLCRKADRLEICDVTLGEILAHAPSGADGNWPFEAARDVLDRPELDDMRRGFEVGIMNKRGVTTRGYDAGGDQERTLAGVYRGCAQVFRTTHPRLAACFSDVARSYEAQGEREDVHARLRIEGH